MKYISTFLFVILLTLTSFVTLADPHYCMSRDEAETLVKKLSQEAYILDYCDCCNDISDTGVNAFLIQITQMDIVPCEYDDTRFSVAIETAILAALKVKNGQYIAQVDEIASEPLFALLNYQFFLHEGQAQALGLLVKKDYERPNCSGIKGFPPAKMVNNRKYKAWLRKKMK